MGRGMSCLSAALSNQLCEPEQRGIMVDEQKVFDNTMPLIPSDLLPPAPRPNNQEMAGSVLQRP